VQAVEFLETADGDLTEPLERAQGDSPHMYIVTLNPRLLEANATVVARSVAARLRAGTPPFSGTIQNGYNEVTASVAPGTSGTVKVSFDVVVLSISSSTFDSFRVALKDILQDAGEENIARNAGIVPPPPPEPSSCMAGYALQLFSEVVFDGEVVSDQSRRFGAPDCTSGECASVLGAVRGLPVMQVEFSGTLVASSESPATEQVAAYVPVTAVEFDDGLTIPFAGYSKNVVVDYNGLNHFVIPGDFWSELLSGGVSGVGTS
jgi:hypothetical protein